MTVRLLWTTELLIRFIRSSCGHTYPLRTSVFIDDGDLRRESVVRKREPMEKGERVGSPLGAPHLGMDFFPVFDSRLDDSPKFRAQLQQWAERSKKVGLQ